MLVFLLTQLLIGSSHGNFTAKDVSEGPCLQMTELFPHLYKKVNLLSVLVPGDYYVPMGSQALYREYAEGLLGRPAATQDELEDMQIVLQCGPAFTTILNKGYHHMEQPPSFGQACEPEGLPSLPNLGIGIKKRKVKLSHVQTVCVGLPAIRPNGSVAAVASESFFTTVDSVIWVNKDETALLVYRCPTNGIKDFKVVSRTKTLNPADIKIMKEKVSSLGFHEDHIASMNYE